MKCHACGNELIENAKFCAKCGAKTVAAEPAPEPAPASAPVSAPAAELGCDISKVWPEWELEKQLGRGSYGTVYQAVRKDSNLETRAAIKMISIPSDPSEIDSLRSEGLDMDGSKTFFHNIVNDFVSEIQLMESLKGIQNVVSVEDYKVVEKTDQIGWDIYIRMELLTPFNTYICDKKLTEEDVIKLGTDICAALELCSQRNIIHRDIKPENLFVNDFGHFKLGDFGIARKLENVTGGLSQKGSPNYMAPEVASGNDYDARVDTYSLGIVLYRLLNGNRLPFLDTEKQILNPNERKVALDRRLRGEELPAPCNASAEMADIILRACAFDPSRRFSSATEMKQALLYISNGIYQISTRDLDRTFSVRQAVDSYDRTTSVRRAPAAFNQAPASTVETFDSIPGKKSKLPIVIAAVLAIILLIGAGIFILPKLLDGDGDTDSGETVGQTTSETAGYSKYDQEQIAAIISEADTLAAEEDYEGALDKIQEGLETYPNSIELQDKEREYSSAMDNQNSASTTVPQESEMLETVPTETSTIIQPIVNISNSAIKNVDASSFLSQSSLGLYHTADRILDGQMDTAWVEGSPLHGIGDSLTLQLDGSYLVSGFTIHGGYHKSESLYYKNSRPQKLLITFSDGSYFGCLLYDVMQEQTFCLESPIVTDSITLEIVSVYEGSEYDDTAITEISLF